MRRKLFILLVLSGILAAFSGCKCACSNDQLCPMPQEVAAAK